MLCKSKEYGDTLKHINVPKQQACCARTSPRNQYNLGLSGGAETGVVMVLSYILNIQSRPTVPIQRSPESQTSELSFNVRKAFTVNLHTYRINNSDTK